MGALNVLAALISQINNDTLGPLSKRPHHRLTTAALKRFEAGSLNWPEWLASKNHCASNQPCLQTAHQEQK